MDFLKRLLDLLRHPEVIYALATVIFVIVRMLVPELQDYVTVEFLVALLTVLLGGGALRYLKRSRQGAS